MIAIVLHRNLDGSPSRQIYLHFDLVPDLTSWRFRYFYVSIPASFKAWVSTQVFQAMYVVLDGQIRSLVSRDLVSCADVCFVSNNCSFRSNKFDKWDTFSLKLITLVWDLLICLGHFPASWNLYTPCELEGSESKCSSPCHVYSNMASGSDCSLA